MITETPPITIKEFRWMLSKGRYEHFIKNAICTFMGRDAIRLAIKFIGLSRPDKALLPGFLCKEVLNPFMDTTRIDFYDLDPNLNVPVAEIEKKLSDKNIKVVYLIHYFGWKQIDIERIKRICSSKGVCLIEDCAHAMFTAGCGEQGDLVIYSLRKLLPTLDGGALLVRNRGFGFVPKMHQRIISDFFSFGILLKFLLHLRNERTSRGALSSIYKRIVKPGRNQNDTDRFMQMSTFTNNILSHINFDKIIEKRRENFLCWLRLIDPTVFKPVFLELPNGVTPFSFPIRVRFRDELTNILAKQNIFLKGQWPLNLHLGDGLKNSRVLLSTTLSLPVFPELDKEKIKFIHDKLNEAYLIVKRRF